MGGGGGGTPCTLLSASAFSGGCRIYLNGPSNCAQIDFNTLGYVEFSWNTDATFCEGPHHFLIGGDPPATWTSGNGLDWSLSSGTHTSWWMERNIGGRLLMTRADLTGLTSVNGQYYWRVTSFYGSASEIWTFTIR